MPYQNKPVSRRTGLATGLRVFTIAVLVVCGLTANSLPASAQTLNDARASGMIGEQMDGFAVARGNATSAARALVATVNGKRRQIYAAQARKQKVPASQVGKVFAGKIAAKAPKGTWIQSSSGAWARK